MAAEPIHQIIGTSEAAELLGVTQRTVQRRADTGQIPVIRTRVGDRREYLFDAAVIRALAHATMDPAGVVDASPAHDAGPHHH